MPEINLRPAFETDANDISICVGLAYEKWIERIGRKPWPMLQNYTEVIANENVVVAEVGGAVVGVLVLSRTPEGFLIDNVAVLPKCSGNGVGRLLLRHAEQEAVSLGYESIYLYTNEKMAENIAMYTKFGYLVYDRRQEEGFRRVFMRKSLN